MAQSGRAILGLLAIASTLAVCGAVWSVNAMWRDAQISTNKGRMAQILLAVEYALESEQDCPFDNKTVSWKTIVSRFTSPELDHLHSVSLFRAQGVNDQRSDILAITHGENCRAVYLICPEMPDLHVDIQHPAVYTADEFTAKVAELSQLNRHAKDSQVIVGQIGHKPYSMTLGEFIAAIVETNAR